jgi:hypothetical protein
MTLAMQVLHVVCPTLRARNDVRRIRAALQSTRGTDRIALDDSCAYALPLTTIATFSCIRSLGLRARMPGTAAMISSAIGTAGIGTGAEGASGHQRSPRNLKKRERVWLLPTLQLRRQK